MFSDTKSERMQYKRQKMPSKVEFNGLTEIDKAEAVLCLIHTLDLGLDEIHKIVEELRGDVNDHFVQSESTTEMLEKKLVMMQRTIGESLRLSSLIERPSLWEAVEELSDIVKDGNLEGDSRDWEERILKVNERISLV